MMVYGVAKVYFLLRIYEDIAYIYQRLRVLVGSPLGSISKPWHTLVSYLATATLISLTSDADFAWCYALAKCHVSWLDFGSYGHMVTYAHTARWRQLITEHNATPLAAPPGLFPILLYAFSLRPDTTQRFVLMSQQHLLKWKLSHYFCRQLGALILPCHAATNNAITTATMPAIDDSPNYQVLRHNTVA